MATFEWDEHKNFTNFIRHQVTFEMAQEAFFDPSRLFLRDSVHSMTEERLFCIGKTKHGIITVRFTMRNNNFRIIGAGFWRKWRKIYEKHEETF